MVQSAKLCRTKPRKKKFGGTVNTKIRCKPASLVLLAILAFAGCSLVGGSSPTATIHDFHRYAENGSADEMVKLYSKSHLDKNKDALEHCRTLVGMARGSKANGHPPSLTDLKETLFGEKAIVKGYYGPTDGSGGGWAFQSRLVQENGDWKIDVMTTDVYKDLTKE
jgi:hypothetical protein